jgi:xylan 1,4-beta-xylosidase
MKSLSMAKRISCLTLVAASLTTLSRMAQSAAEPAYTNPAGDRPIHIREPFAWSNPLPFRYTESQAAPRTEVRDPCIIRDAGTYYLVFTMWPFANREEKRMGLPDSGSSPGIALYCSPDLKTWKFENWLVKSSDLPKDCPYKHRFWAPEIHRLGGKFYLVFTADNWLKKEYNPAGTWGTAGYAFVGVAEKIGGPYEHITYIQGAACDTSLFEDTDGRIYAIIPRYNIDLQEIDLTGLPRGEVRLLGQPRRVVMAENTDIGIPAKPDYLEGPWMEKVNGKYYLFYAEIYRDRKYPEWLGYHTGVAVADSVVGPYKKDPRGKLFTGGHVAVFNGPGERRWFSYRGESDSKARGLLCIDPFQVDSSGWVQTIAPTLGQQERPDTGSPSR